MKMEHKKHDLIITIVNRGYADQVMESAKKNGATGGTVIHARGTGSRDAEKFFGISITPEKELVLILIENAYKAAVMQGIIHDVGIKTPGHGLCFTLPVEDVIGIVPNRQPEE